MSIDSEIPYPPPIHYIPRIREENLLHQWLQKPEKKLALLLGPGGIGKTCLATKVLSDKAYIQERRLLWVSFLNYPPLESIRQEITTSSPELIVLDGTDILRSENEQSGLLSLISAFKQIPTLILSRTDVPEADAIRINISPLTREESEKLFTEYIDPNNYEKSLPKFLNTSHGNPLAISIFSHYLKDFSDEDALEIFQQSQKPIISLSDSEEAEQKIKVARPTVIQANDELIRRLKSHPVDIHKVSPKKFEELIGDLLSNMGFEIHLTPQTKDQGRDIIALIDNEFGKFHCLVEVKKYRKNNPVGVSIIRELLGTYFHHKADKAMLVTSSYFSREAREFQQEHEYALSLKEYSDVVRWLQNHPT